MKNITERHEFIIQQLKKNGKVNIIELIDLMKVSGVTIRKDLKLLEDKNLLFRTRGGGSINNPYATERTINEKEFINSEEKQKIAKAALSIIGQNDSISIGSGTTVFELARCLYPSKHLTVITPALKVGLELSNRPNVEVLQLGGLIRLQLLVCGRGTCRKDPRRDLLWGIVPRGGWDRPRLWLFYYQYCGSYPEPEND